MTRIVISILLCISAFGVSDARDASVRRIFTQQNPCPAIGEPRGACPGWVVDHIVPLCAGGADTTDNMQWQTKEEALEKDKEEWRLCRELRKQRASEY
ncbi:MAG: HNH endonuclease signature motif containing protein [Burkholderiales bacterium]|nr:HNH endonuclease signature motif containing protein [Burkholderiales bacterium]